MSEEETFDALEQVARNDAEEVTKKGPAPAPLTVSINSPHTVDVHGTVVAINIHPSAGAAQSADTVVSGTVRVVLCKNFVPTYYDISATEVGPV